MEMATTSGSRVLIDEAAVQELRMTLHGPLLCPGDRGYDAARVIFNGLFDRRPGMIVRCRGAADVMDAVQFARRHELLVAVRGGGHNVAGNSVCEGGLMIDLSLMHGVSVDRHDRHRAGPGRCDLGGCRSGDAGLWPGHAGGRGVEHRGGRVDAERGHWLVAEQVWAEL